MKAYDFIYDGKNLSDFGFIICDFDSKGINIVSNGSEITFNKVSTLGGSKHELTSTQYDDVLETTIQICKNFCSGDEKPIQPHELREITRWLNRKRFLKFKILDDYYCDLYFEASFNVSRIEFMGSVYGLELNVTTNRPYALKEPETINLKTKKLYTWGKYQKVNDTEKGEFIEYIESYNKDEYPLDGVKSSPAYSFDKDSKYDINDLYYYVYDGEQDRNVCYVNDSSHEEGYIYPYTEITVLEDGDLQIFNKLENRETFIKGCTANEVITMDYPIITSSVESHIIQDDFNWNFFRIANTYQNSRNEIETSIPCEIKIKYSPIVKMGL